MHCFEIDFWRMRKDISEHLPVLVSLCNWITMKCAIAIATLGVAARDRTLLQAVIEVMHGMPEQGKKEMNEEHKSSWCD